MTMTRLRDTSDRMTLQVVQRYASGKAPFLGIPVFDISLGKTVTAVFRREHLQAAVEAATIRGARITYDCVFHTLNFNSVKGCCYRLRDLKNAEGSTFKPWDIKDAQAAWASARRKTAIARTLSPSTRKVARLQLEIGKLGRQRDKIRAERPQNPLIPLAYYLQPASENDREQARRWRAEKPMRQRLGQLVRRERKTWAQFYRDVEAIIGRPVYSSRRHDVVTKRKRRGRSAGPSIVIYLTHLYKYVGMATMPWEQSYKWDPYKLEEYGGERGRDMFARHRSAQIAYLTAMNERVAVQWQIDQHLQTIAELAELEAPSQ